MLGEPTPGRLLELLDAARQTTLGLVADLDDDQIRGSRLAGVPPILWTLGYSAWLYEEWVLRRLLGEAALVDGAQASYGPANIAALHDRELPTRKETLEYMRRTFYRVAGHLSTLDAVDEATARQVMLCIVNEDLQAELLCSARQTLGYPPPRLRARRPVDLEDPGGGPLEGDVSLPGGTFLLGVPVNVELRAVELEPFSIARVPVTNGEFAAFVDDGGYERRDLWHERGWAWREAAQARHPVHWYRGAGGSWFARCFDALVPLDAHLPVTNLSGHEARAWCGWASRRLPNEVEWEAAALAEADPAGACLAERKRRFPWGDAPSEPARANLDALARESEVYTNAYTAAPWTRPSFQTIFTGLGRKSQADSDKNQQPSING